MADELDDILGDTESPGEVQNATPNEAPAKAEIDPEELEHLRKSADLAEQLQAQVGTLSSELERVRNEAQARQQTTTSQVDSPLTTDEIWADPSVIDRRIKKGIEDFVATKLTPLTETTLGNVASVTIGSFKELKRSDPLFAGVEPLFDQEMKGLNKAWLGRLNADQLKEVVDKAWDASLGKYVRVERTKKAAIKAKNLSAGGGSAGSSAKAPSLKDLNALAYQWAVDNNMSEEDMAQIAKEISEETE